MTNEDPCLRDIDEEDIEEDTDCLPRKDPEGHARPNETGAIRYLPCYPLDENKPMGLDNLSAYEAEWSSDEHPRPIPLVYGGEHERQYFIHNDSFSYINPDRVDNAVRIKFFGCNSIYITDGETNILIDPFFTRPRANGSPVWERRRPIRACPKLIEATLDYAGIRPPVHAILMTHAHWDHALDIAEVWHALHHPPESRFPKIFGCPSICNIARGGGVPRECIVFPVLNKIFRIQDFKICFLPGAHGPLPPRAERAFNGDIETMLPQPEDPSNPTPNPFERSRACAYKQGDMADILIEHPHGLILNKGSANFESGYLRRLMMLCSRRNRADSTRSQIPFIDVIILACAGFSTLRLRGILGHVPFIGRVFSRKALHAYNNFWDEVIRPTKPRLLLFSHWDRFTKGRSDRLDRPPSWMIGSRKCKYIFEEWKRENFNYETRFIPFWEDITILPVHNPEDPTAPRVPSAFQMPDGTEIPDLRPVQET